MRVKPVLQMVLSVCIGVAMLAGLEAGVRMYDHFKEGDQSRKTKEPIQPLDMSLEYLTEDDLVLWELKPGFDGTGQGVSVKINGLGLRDIEITKEKPAGVKRILCMGDSVTFGWGVAFQDCYPQQLQRRINDRLGFGKFQVLNAGVPTHSSYQGLLRLENRLLDLMPDVLIFCYGLNDSMWWKTSDFERTERVTIKQPSLALRFIQGLHLFQKFSQRARRTSSDQQSPDPEKPFRRISEADFMKLIERVANLAKSREIELVLLEEVIEPHDEAPYNVYLHQAAEKIPAPVVRIVDAFQTVPRTIPLFVDPWHPTAYGHGIITTRIMDMLEKTGILSKLTQ